VVAWSADPQALANLAATSVVVGLGQSTRAGLETFEVMGCTTQALVERGFRTVAVLDNQRVGDLYDRFVSGADDHLEDAVLQAWGPWRTRELGSALTWIRRRNEQHPGDLVRVIGIGSSRVLPADYDEILALIGPQPEAERLRGLFDVLRSAHRAGEHVQRAHGTHPHPERPFVELAREARVIVAGLPRDPEQDKASRLLDAVVDHHANAIGVGYDAARDEEASAKRILAHYRRSGDRIVLWEGSAHVAAAGTMLGSHLRTELGDDYYSVHITFGRGLAGTVEIPAPQPDSLEDALLSLGACTLDLRREAADIGPCRTRVISGVYKPEEDDKHYLALPTLRGCYDALAFVQVISPTHPLGA
jgi:erythromycin esterase